MRGEQGAQRHANHPHPLPMFSIIWTPTIEPWIREPVNNAQQATADLSHASHQADALVSDLNSRQIPRKSGEVMDNLNDSASLVRQVFSEMNKPDQFGMSAGANIRESLSNANTATANLADATEALKHNFLTRGFFKKRGYYNLADISPAAIVRIALSPIPKTSECGYRDLISSKRDERRGTVGQGDGAAQ